MRENPASTAQLSRIAQAEPVKMKGTSGPSEVEDAGSESAPLVAHVVFRLDYGGLENGLVNLVNNTSQGKLRHCIIALTEATDYRLRLRRDDVEVHALGKRPGKDPAAYLRLFKLLRRLRPSVLHTRNVGTLDCAVLGRFAGISNCIHGEHGWDTHDPHGTSTKYRLLRRMANPWINRFVVVSQELETWLTESVGIDESKVVRIRNGVDTSRFCPPQSGDQCSEVAARFGKDVVVVGSVLRFEAIKDPLNLVNAFLHARERAAERGVRLVLAMVGDGRLRVAAQDRSSQAGVVDDTWFPGRRDDIADLMRSMDIYALPSRREGISNTLLEAMATGLPLVATDTGGNSELVESGANGTLVPTQDAEALGDALATLAIDAEQRRAFARASRARAMSGFSIDSMVSGYEQVYEQVTKKAGR